mmetsp:Transcript_1544/g.2753  ORF Transcript_1544/g.2753 Transcript_1544/m.2753 type:complete len:80 (+) Transcript_1544:48-287(+)
MAPAGHFVNRFPATDLCQLRWPRPKCRGASGGEVSEAKCGGSWQWAVRLKVFFLTLPDMVRDVTEAKQPSPNGTVPVMS